jgi:hypothetical protein
VNPLRRLLRPLAWKTKAFLLFELNAKLDVLLARPVTMAPTDLAADPTARLLHTPNDFIHALRTFELRRSPKVGVRTLLSAGCSGLWYFDWIAENFGRVARHIGVEFYSPKPDGLPANVEWISNTVGDMSAVEDESVDMVFSGANIEHLLAPDVEGFLLESNRVLRSDGWLVMDSSNRTVTSPMRWVQPDHIIEFTVSEARELVELSGFTVTSIRGIWFSMDPVTRRVLPLFPATPDPDWSYLRRLVVGETSPDECFMWWLEARKTGPADEGQLKKRVEQIAVLAAEERAARVIAVEKNPHV